MDLSAGLRYERTKVESPSIQSTPTAVRWAGDNELPVIFSGSTTTLGSGKYSYALPSIDWSADVTDETKLRLSYGKTIGRPGWNALGGRVLNSIARIDGGTGAVGNPNLKPLQSNNFDFSAEHYYAKSSYVAFSYFLKNVKDYNAPVITDQTIPGLTTPIGGAYYRQAIQTGGCAPTDSGCIRQWIFTNLPNAAGVDVANRTITGQPGDPLLVFKLGSFANNERKSRINGIELNAQHIFGNSGYGVAGNFTKVKSDRNYDNNKPGAQSDVLTGMGDSGNLVGFFENANFSARLAYNWRGKFLVANFGGVEGAQPLYVEPYGQFDLGLSYTIDKNLRLSFEAINLTDQYVRTHMRNENQIGSVTKLGRRFTIGAVYKF
jgi:TonB-dependent receptor